jgi:branched-chain amino acid transport system permease protein
MDWSTLLQQLINGLVLGSTYGLIAIGYTMVYGIIGMINFAHGDIYMIATYLTAIFLALFTFFGLTSLSTTLLLTLLFTAIITGLYGFAIERIAYRPLRNSIRLAPLISAIGVSLLLENFVSLSQGANPQAIPALFTGNLATISYPQLMIMLASLFSVSLLTLLITKTRLGREMRAMQQDLKMASMLGINPNKIIPLVFVIGSVMAALAGFLVTLNVGNFDFSIGFLIGIKAFTSAVLGGIGSLPGAMLGGLILGMSETLFAGFISVDYKDVFAFLVLILVLMLKPSGLLGSPELEKV